MEEIIGGLTVFVIFLGMSSPVLIIGLVYYFKKRLEHKQIMAAIEKGTPLSEIIPPKPRPAGPAWIKYVSTGIALIIIGVGFTYFNPMNTRYFGISLFWILCGIGVAMLIRGLLYRKYQPQSLTSDENKPAEAESKVSA